MKEIDSTQQKCNLRRRGKIPSVQLQKLVDSIPSRILYVIKANGGSTKYQIKNLPLYSIVLLIGLIFMLKQNCRMKHKC